MSILDPFSRHRPPFKVLPWTLVRISPSAVHLLRFVLEAYDHAFVITTVDQRSGLVKIAYRPDQESNLNAILRKLAPMIDLRC